MTNTGFTHYYIVNVFMSKQAYAISGLTVCHIMKTMHFYHMLQHLQLHLTDAIHSIYVFLTLWE
jgi:hypothetical protein